MAGMTAYGVLNTLYYTLAFTTAWSFRAIPANLSLAAAFRVAGECMALVWQGRRSRKSPGLGLAVAGAPKMDEGIKSVCAKTGWAYRNVFTCVVFGCFPGERGVLQRARGSQGGARVMCSRERTYPSILLVVHHDVLSVVF